MAESGAAAAEAPPAAQQQPAQPEPASLPLRPPQPPQQPAAAAADSGKRPELCRHWGRTGSCLHGDRCRFAHPAGIAPLAAPRRRTWGGTRAAVRNRSKATVLRRHVIDAFGREALAGGSGIVDVAGGKVLHSCAALRLGPRILVCLQLRFTFIAASNSPSTSPPLTKSSHRSSPRVTCQCPSSYTQTNSTRVKSPSSLSTSTGSPQPCSTPARCASSSLSAAPTSDSSTTRVR